MKTNDVKALRRTVLEFVKSKGGEADRSEIKRHVGLVPFTFSQIFESALKTKKLVPVFGSGEVSPGLFLSRPPVVAYRLAHAHKL